METRNQNRPLITRIAVASAILASGTLAARVHAISETFMVLAVKSPATATDIAAPINLLTFTYDGTTLTQSVLPYAVPSTGSAALTLTSLSGQHDGMLRMSSDGNYLTFGGYRATTGAANPQNSLASSVNRVIGTFNLNTTAFNTSQALDDAYNFAPLSAVVTKDATQFWTAGGVGSPSTPTGTNFDLSGGVRYVPDSTTFHSTNIGMTQNLAGPLQPDSARGALIVGDNLYITTPAQLSYKVQGTPPDTNFYFRGTYQVGTNLITSPVSTPTYHPFMNDLESSSLFGQEIIKDSKGSFVPKSDLVFADLNPSIPGYDTAYGTGGKGDYEKWSLIFDASTSSYAWKQISIFNFAKANKNSSIPDINALALFVEPSGLVDLFATSDNGIYHFTDSNGYTAVPDANETDPTGTIGFFISSPSIDGTPTLLRGIVAIPEPTTAAMLALGALTLLRTRNRERK